MPVKNKPNFRAFLGVELDHCVCVYDCSFCSKVQSLFEKVSFFMDHFMKDFTLTRSEATVNGPSIPPIIGTSGPTFSLMILIASSTAGILPLCRRSAGMAAPSRSLG